MKRRLTLYLSLLIALSTAEAQFLQHRRKAFRATGGAPITLDANSTGAFDNDANTNYTFSHTQGTLSNGYVVVAVSNWVSGVNDPVASATYDGSAMTILDSEVDNTNDNRVTLIGRALGNKAAGTYTVSVTLTSAVGEMRGGASTFNNVHQSLSTDAAAKATGSSTTPSVTVTTGATGDMIVEGHVNWGPTTWTSGAGQTTLWNGSDSSTGGAGSREAGAASVTMSGTLGSTSPWSIVGIPLNQAP